MIAFWLNDAAAGRQLRAALLVGAMHAPEYSIREPAARPLVAVMVSVPRLASEAR
ncbi:MAG: hypothetical protein M5U28_10555 [Sandaracinaceae bacterium]|nr:hypothetical protein [Sandaracinaceae bacterium]